MERALIITLKTKYAMAYPPASAPRYHLSSFIFLPYEFIIAESIGSDQIERYCVFIALPALPHARLVILIMHDHATK
jgi:hypothetical protein